MYQRTGTDLSRLLERTQRIDDDGTYASRQPGPPYRPASGGGDRVPVGGGPDRADGGGDQPRRAPRYAAELPAGRDREPRRAHASPRQRAVRADAPLRKRGAAARAAPLRPRRAAERRRARSAAARRRWAARGDRRQARADAPARDQGRSRRTAPAAACFGGNGGLAGRRRRQGVARPDAGRRAPRERSRDDRDIIPRCFRDRSCGCCG